MGAAVRSGILLFVCLQAALWLAVWYISGDSSWMQGMDRQDRAAWVLGQVLVVMLSGSLALERRATSEMYRLRREIGDDTDS